MTDDYEVPESGITADGRDLFLESLERMITRRRAAGDPQTPCTPAEPPESTPA